MSKVAIVTDSTAYIPPKLAKNYPIFTIPLYLHWGEKIFKDGVDIQPDDFYKKMKSDKEFPISAPPTVNDFEEMYKKVLEQGYDIFSIHISGNMSTTLESARQAKKSVGSEKIAIFDSRITAMTMGFQVLAVAKAAEEGAGLRECQDIAEKAAKNGGLFFVVEGLEYLRRGGRIGNAAKLLGQLLNLKPILTFDGQQTQAVERISGMNRAIDRMLDLVEIELQKLGNPIHIAGLHSGDSTDAEALLERAKKRFSKYLIETATVSALSPVIGSHVGPGTVALCFMAGL